MFEMQVYISANRVTARLLKSRDTICYCNLQHMFNLALLETF